MGFFTINTRYLPIKLHYGAYNSGACAQITMPTYSKEFGFSSYVVGVIYTILPLACLIIKPTFGALADRFKWHRGVLILWVLLTLVGFFSIWFIPTKISPTATNLYKREWNVSVCPGAPSNLTLHDADCQLRCPLTLQRCLDWHMPSFCQDFISWNSSISEKSCLEVNFEGKNDRNYSGCEFHCLSAISDDGTETGTISDSMAFQSWQFQLYLFLLILAYGGISVASTITDTICYEICNGNYGAQRLWGSISWGLSAMIVGFIVDAVSDDDLHKNYSPAFFYIILPLLVDVVLCFKMKFSIPAKSENIARDTWRILLSTRNLVFIFWCIMFGISLGVTWNFEFWLLEELAEGQFPEAKDSIKTIEGTSAAIATFLGETPAFFFGGWIVNRIGHGHCMSLIFILIAIRMTLYWALVNPWWVLPIEIFQNNYGLFYTAMTSFAKKIAPPGTEATIQTILCALAEGVGVAVGSYLGGLFVSLYGASITFLIFGIAFLFMCVCNEIIEFIYMMVDRSI